MSTSKEKAGAIQSYGDRGGVREHAVQRGQASVRSPDERVREDGPVDWRHAFRVLSALTARQFISSDKLVLMAYSLRDHQGEDVLREFVTHAGMNRDKAIQDFMG